LCLAGASLRPWAWEAVHTNPHRTREVGEKIAVEIFFLDVLVGLVPATLDTGRLEGRGWGQRWETEDGEQKLEARGGRQRLEQGLSPFFSPACVPQTLA